MQSARDDELLTAAELAARLTVKPATILGWYRAGKIPGRKLSHKVIRFSLPEVISAMGDSRGATGTRDRHHCAQDARHVADGRGVANG